MVAKAKLNMQYVNKCVSTEVLWSYTGYVNDGYSTETLVYNNEQVLSSGVQGRYNT